MSSATETPDKTDGNPADALVSIGQGQYVLMADGHWFKCDDVNRALSRQVSKIGVALVDFAYPEDKGAAPGDVATFTLRQFYQNRDRPTLDFTEKSVAELLKGWGTWLPGREASVKAVLFPALKRFTKDYKRYEEEREILEHSAGSGGW